MAKDKEVIRLAKGMYFKPENDPVLGMLYPSIEEVAAQIAKNKKVVIRPTDSYVLNKLGLSTQALLAINKKELTEKIYNSLLKVLSHEPPEDIREGARLAPLKVAETLYKMADKIEHQLIET